jgi:hypothetical protein
MIASDRIGLLITMRPEGTRIVVNGVDLSRHCRAVKVEAGVGAQRDVWLELVGVNVDILAEVPRAQVQQLTHEDDQAHQEAQLTIDQQRGQRRYGRKGVTPSDAGILRLAASLGEVKP